MATVHFCAFLGSVPSDAASHTYSKRLCHTGGTVNCVVQITCGAVKISSCVRNSRGWILAQANNCRTFAIDISKAVIPLQTPKEMWWTQTRALQRALLDPITHLPWQPFSLHSPQHSLRIFCSLHVHRTLDIMATPWLSDIPSWAGSVLAQASVPAEPSVPHSVVFLVLLSVSPAASSGWGSFHIPSSLLQRLLR